MIIDVIKKITDRFPRKIIFFIVVYLQIWWTIDRLSEPSASQAAASSRRKHLRNTACQSWPPTPESPGLLLVKRVPWRGHGRSRHWLCLPNAQQLDWKIWWWCFAARQGVRAFTHQPPGPGGEAALVVVAWGYSGASRPSADLQCEEEEEEAFRANSETSSVSFCSAALDLTVLIWTFNFVVYRF